VAEIVAQQESHKPASVPIDDHDSEIDFARLFARTIADKERLQWENAMLLEENSRLNTRVEELEVASMLQIQVSRLLGMSQYCIVSHFVVWRYAEVCVQPEDSPSKYYTPMSTPEASSRVVHIENKHLTSLHRKISAPKGVLQGERPSRASPTQSPNSCLHGTLQNLHTEGTYRSLL
jgi:hypothetical protein